MHCGHCDCGFVHAAAAAVCVGEEQTWCATLSVVLPHKGVFTNLHRLKFDLNDNFDIPVKGPLGTWFPFYFTFAAFSYFLDWQLSSTPPGCMEHCGRGQDYLTLRQLPPSLKQHSLDLEWWKVQLQPGHGFQGVLWAAAAGLPLLKQLRLCCCVLLDGVASLEAALLQLPALEHLNIWGTHSVKVDAMRLMIFPNRGVAAADTAHLP